MPNCVKFLSYGHEKKIKWHKMLPCCFTFVPDSISKENKYPPTSVMRSNVQRKCVQRLIKPMLWYRRKRGRVDEWEHDSQTSLQPLLVLIGGNCPQWAMGYAANWDELEILTLTAAFLGALDATPLTPFAPWHDLVLSTSLLAVRLLFISWTLSHCASYCTYICIYILQRAFLPRNLAVSIHLGLCTISVHYFGCKALQGEIYHSQWYGLFLVRRKYRSNIIKLSLKSYTGREEESRKDAVSTNCCTAASIQWLCWGWTLPKHTSLEAPQWRSSLSANCKCDWAELKGFYKHVQY